MSAMTLLNTRPLPQAQALTKLIQDAGVQVIECPSIQIDYLPLASERTNFSCDYLVFTSVHAVKGYIQAGCCNQNARNAKVFAIGKATSVALEAAGFHVEHLAGEQFDSEALLQTDAFANLHGVQVCLVKGVGGRELIADTVLARNGELQTLEVYQRNAMPFCHDAWQSFIQQPHPVWLVSSVESFEALYRPIHTLYADTNSMQRALSHITVIAFSERIANQLCLLNLGVKAIEIVVTQSNQGILQSLQRLDANLVN